MCRIAGVVTASPLEGSVSAAELMGAEMRHRGPDSQGVATLSVCVLVNTRLAILDLSDRGRMPMSNAQGTVWITYNGETYNAPELRAQLVARGYQFRSTSDSEVVLHLYEEYGERCVESLRGMFAFATWDGRSNKLTLARDRLGIKPRYLSLSEANWSLAPSSKRFRLLRDMDATSMAHSIEVRPLFVDYRLVEVLLGIPACQRIHRVFAPERLSATGVSEPSMVLALWNRYQHSSNSTGWSRIWSLFVLRRWCETMQMTP